jgi:hypothetical protein
MGSMLNIPSRMEGPEQKTIIGKTGVIVSAKGIANGKSVYLNDGADFGPDTKLGATIPGQYGPPFTKTVGLQEAFNYSDIVEATGDSFFLGSKVVLSTSGYHKYIFHGQGRNTSILAPSGLTSSDNVFGFDSLNAITECDIGGFTFDGQNNTFGTGLYFANPTEQSSRMKFHDIYIRNVLSGQKSIDVSHNEDTTIERIRSGAGDNGTLYSNTPTGSQTFILCAAYNYDLIVQSPVMINCAINNTLTFAPTDSNNLLLMILPYWNSANANAFASAGSVTANVRMEGAIGFRPGNSFFSSSAGINVILEQSQLVNTGASTYLAYFTSNTLTQNFKFVDCQISGYTLENSLGDPLSSLSLTANPPVSGTVYQNTNPFDIEINLPVYATTSGTAGKVAIAKGMTSTPSSIGSQYVNGATSSTSADIIRLKVPAAWYYSFTETGVTFGTASIFAD